MLMSWRLKLSISFTLPFFFTRRLPAEMILSPFLHKITKSRRFLTSQGRVKSSPISISNIWDRVSNLGGKLSRDDELSPPEAEKRINVVSKCQHFKYHGLGPMGIRIFYFYVHLKTSWQINFSVYFRELMELYAFCLSRLSPDKVHAFLWQK